MNSFRGKILVIRGGAIGDFILTVPAITALRNQFPEAHLEVLGYSHIVQLAQKAGLVDRTCSIEARALAGFFARNGDLSADLTDYFSEFDVIVSYLYDPDLIFRTNVARCTTAQFIAGPHRPDPGATVHAAEVFLKPLERLAIFAADPVPRLNIGTTTSVSVSPSLPRTLALHPGSGGEQKNWAEQGWAALLEKLVNQTSFHFLLVGGEAEGERLQRLAAALPPARTRVAQSLPLVDLALLLANCDAFVGHDSGISHFTAALGFEGLLLWGPSQAEVWRPPSEKMRLLRCQSGLTGLAASEVFAEICNRWSQPT